MGPGWRRGCGFQVYSKQVGGRARRHICTGGHLAHVLSHWYFFKVNLYTEPSFCASLLLRKCTHALSHTTHHAHTLNTHHTAHTSHTHTPHTHFTHCSLKQCFHSCFLPHVHNPSFSVGQVGGGSYSVCSKFLPTTCTTNMSNQHQKQ